MEDQISCCFTGYRPSKMPFRIETDDSGYVEFENRLTDIINDLIDTGCRHFFSGAAMGFDIIAAESVLLAKKYCPEEIRLSCVIPFIEQSAAFTPFWKKRYDTVLQKCDDVILISDTYFKGCYMKRNRYMVDNSDCVVTWFDGRPGGTKNTLDYAVSRGRHIINIFDRK